MKSIFTTLFISSSFIVSAQNVGVNTNTPASSLQVVGVPASAGVADGITFPKLSGDQLKAKDGSYNAPQQGTIVYVTAAAVPTTAKTINVIAEGLYIFDGSVWQASFRKLQGQFLNNIFIDNPGGTGVYSSPTTPATGTTAWTNVISYTYTPLSGNSKILVQYINNNYTIGGNNGSVNDQIQTQLLIYPTATPTTTPITLNTQTPTQGVFTNSNSADFRSGSLFPIAAVYSNTGTAQITILIQGRRSLGDDTVDIELTNGTLMIQEISN